MKHYSREMEMLYERIKEGSLNDVVWEQKQISVKLIKKWTYIYIYNGIIYIQVIICLARSTPKR